MYIARCFLLALCYVVCTERGYLWDNTVLFYTVYSLWHDLSEITLVFVYAPGGVVTVRSISCSMYSTWHDFPARTLLCSTYLAGLFLWELCPVLCTVHDRTFCMRELGSVICNGRNSWGYTVLFSIAGRRNPNKNLFCFMYSADVLLKYCKSILFYVPGRGITEVSLSCSM